MSTDNQGLLFVGCLAPLAAYLVVVARRRTALWGLNAFNLFMVASATLPGLFFGVMFDLLPNTFTTEHFQVVSYSILGLLAMVGGIYIGWSPLGRSRQKQRLLINVRPAHLTKELGWLTFSVGATAELALVFVARVPTVSTGVYCVAALAKIGLCILLTVAIQERRWNRFLTALALFQLLSIVGSLSSGFSFIRIRVLVPLVAMWLVSRGLDFRNLLRWTLLVPVCAATLFITSSAWLKTRAVIREGQLEDLPLTEKAEKFFSLYVSNVTNPDPESIMEAIMFRVDMTEILAAQVRYQPAVEPYAMGGTLLPAMYGLVPRAIWRDKPIIAGGSAFVTNFTGLRWDDATSVGLPYPFELYANGGPLLVIVGLAAIGFVCARLELKLMAPPKSLGGFWALALVTAVLTEGGERMETMLPSLVASAIAAYGLGILVERWRGLTWPGTELTANTSSAQTRRLILAKGGAVR